MPNPEVFGWWGEEGGHRLDVKCWTNGTLELTVTTSHQPPSVVTLTGWRALRLWQWYNEHTDVTPSGHENQASVDGS